MMDITDKKQINELKQAIIENRFDDFKLLFSTIEESKKLAITPFRFDYNCTATTLVHLAVKHGRYETLEYLLQNGISVNQRTHGLTWSTILHIAVNESRIAEYNNFIRLLLSHPEIDVN